MSRFLQLVLDIFDGVATPAPAQPQPQPPALHGPHLPSEPLGQVLPKAHYAHPRATRRIQLGSTDVAYAFRRGKRRTIGMAIGPDGLEVSAPRWVTAVSYTHLTLPTICSV